MPFRKAARRWPWCLSKTRSPAGLPISTIFFPAGTVHQWRAFPARQPSPAGAKGATIDGLVEVHSHAQGLAQCRERLRSLGLTPVMHPDTAGAARDIAERGDLSVGAIASELAGQIYGLEVLSPRPRTRNTTPRASHHVAYRCHAATEWRDDDDNAGVQVPQRSGGALQGAWRVRHQRHQPDQAGKLYPPRLDRAAQFYVDVEGHAEAPEMRLPWKSCVSTARTAP